MKSFSAHLYSSFLRINGWLVGAVALILTIAAYSFKPDDKVSIGLFITTAAISILIIVVLIDAAYVSWRESQRGLPEIKKILNAPSEYSGISKLLIAAPSELFGVDVLVSVYVKEDEYERLIGIGRVLTIQVNGFIQIGMTSITETNGDMIDKFNNNDASFLNKLLVKPSVPSFLLENQNVG